MGFLVPSRVFPHTGRSPLPAFTPPDVSRFHVSAVPVRLQGIVPRASPLPPTKGRGPIPSWRSCSSRVSFQGHRAAVLPRPRDPSTTSHHPAFAGKAETKPTTCWGPGPRSLDDLATRRAVAPVLPHGVLASNLPQGQVQAPPGCQRSPRRIMHLVDRFSIRNSAQLSAQSFHSVQCDCGKRSKQTSNASSTPACYPQALPRSEITSPKARPGGGLCLRPRRRHHRFEDGHAVAVLRQPLPLPSRHVVGEKGAVRVRHQPQHATGEVAQAGDPPR